MWRALNFWLRGVPKLPAVARVRGLGLEDRPPAAVVALAAFNRDREVLTSISRHGPWDVHFADSRVEAWEIVHRLRSPVVLYDRDWPNAEWRTTVHTFSVCPQRPCVILMSRVADDYLWQELIRCGGHDLLAKPLQADDVHRALKRAWSYWNSARAAASR